MKESNQGNPPLLQQNGGTTMTLQQLRYLIAIAEYGSINAAAQNLYASQSNLSTAVKDLEKGWASPCSRAATAA